VPNPKPRAFEQTEQPTQCQVCRHPWLGGFIEDSLRLTRDAGSQRPGSMLVYRGAQAAARDAKDKHPMPSSDSIRRHLSNRHSPYWNEWTDAEA